MKHICITISMVFLCILVSCERDRDARSSGAASVGIRLQLTETATAKSLPQVSEALVRDLNIFIYDPEGSLAESYYTDSPEKEIYLNLAPDRIHSVYAIANSGDLTGDSRILTSESLRQISWELSSPEGISGEEGEIPMSGMIVPDGAEDGETLTVPLTRMLSKFRIIADLSELDSNVTCFDITGIGVRNMNRSVGYFHDSRAVSSEGIFGQGMTAEGADLSKLLTSGVDFYIPENMQGDLLSGNTDERNHIPPDPYGDLCTFVEIHVKYRSNEHYNDNMIYRYYLHDGRDMDNFDLVRNTMYTCRTVFAGSGINEDSWRIDLSGMKDLVTSISVSPDSIAFFEGGETRDLTATVLPASAEKPDVQWSSDNENVATVSTEGTVTAIRDGRCCITASSTDGSGVSDSAKVYVYIKDKRFNILALPDTLFPGYNSPMAIKYDVYPSSVPDFSVSALSGDMNGAYVHGDTLVALNPDGIQGHVGTYMLKGKVNGITREKEFAVNAGEIRLAGIAGILNAGISRKSMLETLWPADITTAWSSSDENIAKVSQDGTVYPQKGGRCYIKVQSASGACDSTIISVKDSYLSFADVTLYEGAVWELSSGLRPVSSDINVKYSVVKGSQYVSINGNQLSGLKRTDGFSEVTIEARLVDYPGIYARASVNVLPAVSVCLDGDDNRLVNTVGYKQIFLPSDNFSRSLKLETMLAPNVNKVYWTVKDSDGNTTKDVNISEDGAITPASGNVNGTYLITGWDQNRRYCSEPVEIEIYRLIEYEVGIESYKTTYPIDTIRIKRRHNVNLEARFYKATWDILSAYEQFMLMQQKVLTFPESSSTLSGIGAYDRPEIYAKNFDTGILERGFSVYEDMKQFKPYSYLISSFDTPDTRVPGTEGVYYKFNAARNEGFTGYYFFYQASEDFYNSQ